MKALAFVLALALALPARADCLCAYDANGDCIADVTCDAATFNTLVHSEQDAVRLASLCEAGNKRLEAELVARLARVEALERALADTSPPAWVYVAGGGLVAAVVLVLFVR